MCSDSIHGIDTFIGFILTMDLSFIYLKYLKSTHLHHTFHRELNYSYKLNISFTA